MFIKKLTLYIFTCRIAGKLGGDNVWRYRMDADFGKKIVWRMNRLALIVTTNLDWQNANDSPNLPNFPPVKHSQYTYDIYSCIFWVFKQKIRC